MKIEKLSNKKSVGKGILIGFVICLIFVIVVSLFTSKAKYQNTQSINIATGRVSYSASDLNIVAMYKINDDGSEEKLDEVPRDGYILNSEKSKCTIKGANGEEEKDSKITIGYSNNEIKIDHMTKKGTKCYIYFEKAKILTAEQTLAKLGIHSNETLNADKLTGPSCDAEYCYSGASVKSMKQNGVYEVKDQDNNSSYVYRGTIGNNWLKFGGYWWRIIRINGNGSVRVIYAGSEVDGPQSLGEKTEIGSIVFNSQRDDNMYVGFRYTSGERQGNEKTSTILGDDKNPAAKTLNRWYIDNIESRDLEKYIEKNEIFCNDRRSSTSSRTEWGSQINDGGTGTIETYYGAYLRTHTNGSWGSTQQATLTCEEADKFSVKESTVGNNSLKYPIGLITADEVLLAGGFGYQENTSYWLYTSSAYWTMSPFIYTVSNLFFVYGAGQLASNYANVSWGVRPVINLKAEYVKIGSGTGDPGTTGHPYEVV